MGTWPWPQECGAGRVGSTPVHLCHVAAAKRWFDAEGLHRLDLASVKEFEKPTDEAGYPFRWLHVEANNLDFDEFQTIALNTPNLSRDWKIVVLSLLTRVRKIAKNHDGNSWNTWVMRADSAELTMPKKYKTGLTAMSSSFPYFAVGKKNSPHSASAHRFAGCGLFEWIIDRNFEQSFPKMAKDTNDAGFIYTAHVWSIILDKSETACTTYRVNDTADTMPALITYGPMSYEGLQGKSISLLQSSLSATDAPPVVQIVDEWGCTFLLELQTCDTYFVSIQESCVKELS
jgi:hypothetical protein